MPLSQHIKGRALTYWDTCLYRSLHCMELCHMDSREFGELLTAMGPMVSESKVRSSHSHAIGLQLTDDYGIGAGLQPWNITTTVTLGEGKYQPFFACCWLC